MSELCVDQICFVLWLHIKIIQQTRNLGSQNSSNPAFVAALSTLNNLQPTEYDPNPPEPRLMFVYGIDIAWVFCLLSISKLCRKILKGSNPGFACWLADLGMKGNVRVSGLGSKWHVKICIQCASMAPHYRGSAASECLRPRSTTDYKKDQKAPVCKPIHGRLYKQPWYWSGTNPAQLPLCKSEDIIQVKCQRQEITNRGQRWTSGMYGDAPPITAKTYRVHWAPCISSFEGITAPLPVKLISGQEDFAGRYKNPFTPVASSRHFNVFHYSSTQLRVRAVSCSKNMSLETHPHTSSDLKDIIAVRATRCRREATTSLKSAE